MLDVEAFILVGGESSRMGTDKSQLVLGGRTSVDRIAGALVHAASTVRLVGRTAAGADLSFEIVPDLYESWGPLGGIHAALTAASTEWAIIVACDLPFVTTEVFRRLLQYADQDVDAIVPMQKDHHSQPLCAIYRRVPCLAAAERSIARDEHSPRAILNKVRTRYLDFKDLADLESADYLFINVNTPENYERAKEILVLQFPALDS